jgi:DNA recombination protein RmuC
MPNMSPFELLFALLLVFIVASIGGVAFLVLALVRRADTQAHDLVELRAQLSIGGQSQEASAAELRERLTQTQSAFEGVRSALTARQQVEDEARQSLRRLEAVIAGSSTRGAAGENILEESLRHLPPDMITRNLWVSGKVVEFGLRLPGGKVMPLDSKWTSSAALEELASPECEAARRGVLVTQIEREVERRVREVAQYIDPTTTTPWALASVPDAAYAVCRQAFAEAHRRNVILVGYSMTMPYLLALYQMHLQFARTVDMENLQATLMDMDRQLDMLEGVLENRLQRAVTMLQNAYGEGKQVSARIRASVHGIQNAERLAEAEPGALPLPLPAGEPLSAAR